jgi:hypothetical protein
MAARPAERPTTMQQPSGASMTRQGSTTNAASISERTATPMSRQTTSPSASQPRPAPTFNANQSRPQTQEFSNRGAQSRATMNATPPGNAGGGAPPHNAGGGGQSRNAGGGGERGGSERGGGGGQGT